jgi:hypothetical protein
MYNYDIQLAPKADGFLCIARAGTVVGRGFGRDRLTAIAAATGADRHSAYFASPEDERSMLFAEVRGLDVTVEVSSTGAVMVA